MAVTADTYRSVSPSVSHKKIHRYLNSIQSVTIVVELDILHVFAVYFTVNRTSSSRSMHGVETGNGNPDTQQPLNLNEPALRRESRYLRVVLGALSVFCVFLLAEIMDQVIIGVNFMHDSVVSKYISEKRV